MGGTQARIQDFLKRGGVKTFNSQAHPPPPLGHCPCDVAYVIHIPRGGGGVIGPGHEHFA